VLLTPVSCYPKGGWIRNWKKEGNKPAIVATVANAPGFPCLNTSDTVFVVPVDGDQVILNAVPTEMLAGSVVNENGFWASAMVAITARRRVVNCILISLYCVSLGILMWLLGEN
jgi:hypothetical protein